MRLARTLPIFVILILGAILPLRYARAQTCFTSTAPPDAWWTFDETNGDVAHDLASGRDALATVTPKWEEGQVGGTATLRNAAHFVVPDDDLWTLGTSDFTVELWGTLR